MPRAEPWGRYETGRFITSLASVVILPVAARAQQVVTPVIGLLSIGSPDCIRRIWHVPSGFERGWLRGRDPCAHAVLEWLQAG